MDHGPLDSAYAGPVFCPLRNPDDQQDPAHSENLNPGCPVQPGRGAWDNEGPHNPDSGLLAMSRLPALTLDALSAEQRRVYDQIAGSKGRAVVGPLLAA